MQCGNQAKVETASMCNGDIALSLNGPIYVGILCKQFVKGLVGCDSLPRCRKALAAFYISILFSGLICAFIACMH